MEKLFPDYPCLVARPLSVPGCEVIDAGLFAANYFSPGEVVLRLDWEDTARAQIVAWEDTAEEEQQYRCTAIAPKWYFCPNNDHPFWFLNHSCNSNVAYRSWAGREDGSVVSLVALREICLGDEVTIDYSTMTTSDDGLEGAPWVMQCLCGESNCRKLLTDFVSLPRECQMKMLLVRQPVFGIVPAFIVNESPELVNELKCRAPELYQGFQSVLDEQFRLAKRFATEY